jgi:hypothetical protein
MLMAVSMAFLGPARADFHSDISELADDLAETLNGLGEDQVLIGQFTGPAIMNQASASAGIVKILRESFQKKKIAISRRAKFAIAGSYKRVFDGDGRPKIIISGRFEDNQTGESFGGFEKTLKGNREENIAQLMTFFGVSTTVPTDIPTRQREQAVLSGITDPKVFLEKDSRLRTASDSPYAIEILTWKGDLPEGVDPATLNYQPQSIQLNDGLAFAPIDLGHVYAIRVFNDSAMEAAISLSIDGLDLFSFANHKPEHLILPPKTFGTIYGWYRTETKSDAFTITSYANSAVKELGVNPQGIGLISVTFRQAWSENASIPEDEFAAKMLASRGENATGRGASIQQHYRPWRGHIGAVRNVISLRYQHAE